MEGLQEVVTTSGLYPTAVPTISAFQGCFGLVSGLFWLFRAFQGCFGLAFPTISAFQGLSRLFWLVLVFPQLYMVLIPFS